MSRRYWYAAEVLRVLLGKYDDGEQLGRAEVKRALKLYDDAAAAERLLMGG